MHRSIRFRVTAIAVVLCSLLLTMASLVIVLLLRTQLTDNVDEGLRQRADTIEAALAGVPIETISRDEDLLVQLVRPGGERESTANLRGVGPIVPAQVGLRTINDVPGRGEHFRVLTRAVTTPAGAAMLHVGINFDDVTNPVSIVSRLLFAIVPVAVVLLAVLVWWLTGRMLRPVEAIRREMAAITATTLDRRVPVPHTGDEIHRLAQTANGTLDRLEDAIRRQNRFVSDASHELRGPLTRMRGELDLDASRLVDSQHSRINASILAETIEMQRLVEDLLHLARVDGGADPLAVAALDLDDIVLRETRRIREAGRLVVDTSAVSAAQVIGDQRQLTRAISNLLDNAQRHARSLVIVALAEIDGYARLTVADDGPGVPPAEREHVFERFARLDNARTRDAGGSGLGLAIARDIVQRHRGTLIIDDDGRFAMRLPAATAE